MHITHTHIYIYIFSNHKNMGYAPGLVLGRCRVSKVSTNRLLGFLPCEDLLLVFLDNLVVLWLADGYEVYLFVIYMK